MPNDPYPFTINTYSPRFVFPQENQGDYRGFIRFEAFDEDYQSLADLAGRGAAAAALGGGASATELFNNEFEDIQNILASNLTGSQYQTKSGKSNKTINRGEAILYLPQSIQIQDNIQYGSLELGAIGATAMQGVAAGAGALGLAGEALKNTMSDIAAAAFGDLGDAGAAAAVQRTARRFGAPQIAGAVATSTGVTINPNNRNILNGVGLRTFRFQFKLIPTSAVESEVIKKMIKWFRMAMYPDIGVPLSRAQGTSLTLKYPSKFNITMEYGDFSNSGIPGETKQVATGLLPCFLQGFDAVYNPNAMAFHTDGNPQEIDISLNFVEERTLNRNDVENDGNDYNDYLTSAGAG